MTKEQINQGLLDLRALLNQFDANPTDENSVKCMSVIMALSSGMQANIRELVQRATFSTQTLGELEAENDEGFKNS